MPSLSCHPEPTLISLRKVRVSIPSRLGDIPHMPLHPAQRSLVLLALLVRNLKQVFSGLTVGDFGGNPPELSQTRAEESLTSERTTVLQP